MATPIMNQAEAAKYAASQNIAYSGSQGLADALGVNLVNSSGRLVSRTTTAPVNETLTLSEAAIRAKELGYRYSGEQELADLLNVNLKSSSGKDVTVPGRQKQPQYTGKAAEIAKYSAAPGTAVNTQVVDTLLASNIDKGDPNIITGQALRSAEKGGKIDPSLGNLFSINASIAKGAAALGVTKNVSTSGLSGGQTTNYSGDLIGAAKSLGIDTTPFIKSSVGAMGSKTTGLDKAALYSVINDRANQLGIYSITERVPGTPGDNAAHVTTFYQNTNGVLQPLKNADGSVATATFKAPTYESDPGILGGIWEGVKGIATELSPIISLMLPNLGLTGLQLLAAQSAQAIATGASPEQVIRGAIGSLAAAQVPQYLDELKIVSGASPALKAAINNAAVQATFAAFTDQNIALNAIAGAIGGTAAELSKDLGDPALQKAIGEFTKNKALGMSDVQAGMAAAQDYAQAKKTSTKAPIEERSTVAETRTAQSPDDLSADAKTYYQQLIDQDFTPQEALSAASSVDPKFKSATYGQQVGSALVQADQVRSLKPIEVVGSRSEQVDPKELTLDELRELKQQGIATEAELVEYEKRLGMDRKFTSGINFSKIFDPKAPPTGGVPFLNVGSGSSVGTGSNSWFELFGFTSAGNPIYSENTTSGTGPLFTMFVVDGKPILRSPDGTTKTITVELEKKLQDTAETEKKKYNESNLITKKIPETPKIDSQTIQSDTEKPKTDVTETKAVEAETDKTVSSAASAAGGAASGAGSSGITGGGGNVTEQAAVSPAASAAGQTELSQALSTNPVDVSNMTSTERNNEMVIRQAASNPGISNYYISMASNYLRGAGESYNPFKVRSLASSFLRSDFGVGKVKLPTSGEKANVSIQGTAQNVSSQTSGNATTGTGLGSTEGKDVVGDSNVVTETGKVTSGIDGGTGGGDGRGTGDQVGNGDTSGKTSGDGTGDGTGTKVGDGSGTTAGDGAGDGKGTGDGTGDGTGNGDGTGDGTTVGDGTGDGTDDGTDEITTKKKITRKRKVREITSVTPQDVIILDLISKGTPPPQRSVSDQDVMSMMALTRGLSAGDPGEALFGGKLGRRKNVWNVESLRLKDELGG